MNAAGWCAALLLSGVAVHRSGGAEAQRSPTEPPARARLEVRDRRALARIEAPPLGLPPLPLPARGRPSAETIRLGRQLFLDRRLSRNGTLSCAMCHVPEQGFTSNELQTAVGHLGKTLSRNSPTLLNAAYAAPFFHDGREPVLELQPLDVFANPDEMASPSLGALVAKVASAPEYAEAFARVFAAAPTLESIGLVLASYVRSLLSANSPFDRWRYGGDPAAMSAAAMRGFDLFTGRARCHACHLVGDDHALFTDHDFHDTGIGWHATMVRHRSRDPVRVRLAPGVFTDMKRAQVQSVGKPPPNDLGRYRVTGRLEDRWRFKTPSLRNVALTAPYMHDGSISSLGEVVEFYDAGAFPHDGLDRRLSPLGLDASQRDDLVAFLESLTGDNIEELIEDARSERVRNPE